MTDAQPRVTLWVDGRRHEGWSSVSVTLNFDHISGDFTLALTDRYLDHGQYREQPIAAGAACSVEIGGETVITGWVDSAAIKYDAGTSSVAVAGRDATGDLVDCSAVVKEYLNQTLEAVARDLCAPFGIKVVAAADTGAPFKRVAVNTGDTVKTTLERLCRQRRVVAWTDGLGALIIGHSVIGKPVAELKRGVNLLAASATGNFTGRFSEIIVRGPRETPGSADSAAGSQEQGVARDAAVKRYRPKIMVPETQGAAIDLNERAAFEQRVAQGKSRTVTAKVQGWRHGGGLWRPGQTVAFTDDRLGIDGLWQVINAKFTMSDTTGTVTDLTLFPPGAFDALAQPENPAQPEKA